MTESVSSKLLKLMSVIIVSTILAFTLSARVNAVGSSNSGGNEEAGNSSATGNQDENTGNGQSGESAEDRQARRQNACKAGQTKMEQIRNRLTANGESFQNKVNGVLERLDDFAEKKGLESAEMTRLREQVNEFKNQAQNTVQEQKQNQGSVDCNNPDGVMSMFREYKSSVSEYKEDAKAYVAKVKAYAQEVKKLALAE